MSDDLEQNRRTHKRASHFKQAGTGQRQSAGASQHQQAGASQPEADSGFDPFVSTEDPYPYASITPMAHAGNGFATTDGASASSGGAGDTDEYLIAAIRSEQERRNAAKQANYPSDVAAYQDVNHYRQAPRKKGRGARIAIAVVAVLAVIGVGVAVAAHLFISDIDQRLSANVTEDLREQLTVVSEPGDPFYLLLLGVDKDQSRWEGDDSADYGSDEHAYRSDSIMLCRIDPKNVKVTMVSIHRDTLVTLEGYGPQKINAAYAIGGSAYATQVISEFAGVPISHYAEIDLDRFISIVDMVGGVTVNLPVPVYDPDYTGLDLPAGEQMLNGTDAALLCRCRHGYDQYGDGDRFRAANQRMVFSAVIKKVLKSDPATIATTISAMADSVTTDMNVASILDLATQFRNLNVETDIMTGMEPTDGVLIDGVWYEMCLTEQWEKMMSRVDQGLPPYDEGQGEYDSTAGIAGGVGEAGERAVEAAIANDRAEAIAQETGAGE